MLTHFFSPNYKQTTTTMLSGEAKTLAAHYKMKVIEASTFEELERAFTTLLDGSES